MGDVKPRRRYHSPRRAAQSAATRAAIVASARRLFAEQGYASTSIEAIARDAQVAVQTIYAIFGSKRAMLSALLDTLEQQVDLPKMLGELRAATSPLAQLRLIVHFNRLLWEHGSDIVAIIRGAGDSHADLADMDREGEGRRRAGQRPLIDAWAATGALRHALDPDQAADILWTLTSPDIYRMLVNESGWRGDDYEAWLTEALARALFGERD